MKNSFFLRFLCTFVRDDLDEYMNTVRQHFIALAVMHPVNGAISITLWNSTATSNCDYGIITENDGWRNSRYYTFSIHLNPVTLSIRLHSLPPLFALPVCCSSSLVVNWQAPRYTHYNVQQTQVI